MAINELIRTFEVECDADGIAAIRVELLRSIEDPPSYRLRLWRLETYRVQPRFGSTPNETADDSFWSEWTYALARDHKEAFAADSVDAATAVAVDTLRAIVGDIDRARSCLP